VSERRPIAVLDVTKEKGYMYPELAKREGLCSLLSMPMMIKERVIGVINSYTSQRYIFSEDEIKILQAVANQAAVTIENTRLLEKSIEMEDALATRKFIERAKGILMKERGITEDEAFRMIQKQSMDFRRSMREVAEVIILGSELKRIGPAHIEGRRDAQT
ncbi:MAG: GAF and ANTAR domain-containing protein, partial [Nitrospirota bacterium]